MLPFQDWACGVDLGTKARAIRNLFFWRFWLLSGCRCQFQTSAVEVNRINEVLFIAESSRRVFYPLDFGVDGFAGSIRDLMPQVGNDVLEAALQHRGHVLHGLQSATHRPLIPPLKMFAGRLFVPPSAFPRIHPDFFVRDLPPRTVRGCRVNH